MGDLSFRALVSKLLPRCLQAIAGSLSDWLPTALHFCIQKIDFGLTNEGRYNHAR
jgi:hypothetical protein